MKNNRRYIALIMCAVILCLFCGCSSYSDSLERVLGEKVIRIGVSENACPMSFLDDSGKLTGFSIDVGKKLADRLGAEAEFITVEEDGIIEAFDDDIIDCYLNLPAPDRKLSAQLLTADGLIDYRQVVIVPTGSLITRLFQLRGWNIGVVSQSDAGEALTAASELRASCALVVSCSDLEEVFDRMYAGEISAAAVDEPLFLYKTIGARQYYTILDDPIASGDYVIAFRPRDTQLCQRIEQVYWSLYEDGILAEAMQKWLGA